MLFTLSQQYTIPYDDVHSYFTIAIKGKHILGHFYTYNDEYVSPSWVSNMHFAFFDEETRNAWKGKTEIRNNIELAILN